MSSQRELVVRVRKASTTPSGATWTTIGRHSIAFVAQAGLTVAALTATALSVMVVIGPIELLSFVAFPIASSIASVLTLAIVAIVGLPLRLVPVLRRWWTSNGEVMALGTAVGVVTIIGSFEWGGSVQPFTDPETGGTIEFFVPHGWTLLAGWLLLGFSLAHIWWPRRGTRLVVRVRNYFRNRRAKHG